jgi:hypothetical protein
MREHTPTPWSLGSHNLRAITKDAEGIADGCDAYMVAVASAHSLLSPDEAVANAAYIVKACNAFPDLVKALEDARVFMVEMRERHGDSGVGILIKAADEALRPINAAVKGGQGHGHG